MTLIKVLAVRPLGGHRLWIEFSDGSRGERDFSDKLPFDRPAVAALKDPALFARAFVQRGAPTWPNGFDLAPWALHEDMLRDRSLQKPPHAA